MVVVCALAAVVVFNGLDARESVLAASQPLAVGHTVADVDLRVVRVSSSGLEVVPSAGRADVVGRRVAVPVAAGTLLTPGLFGEPAWPPSGQSLVAVAVKTGRLPAGAASGSRVMVFVPPAAVPGSGGGGPGLSSVVSVDATITEVRGDPSGVTIVTLLVAAADAPRLAGAVGDPSVVLLGMGR
ncbi:hypothetical protein Lfu02_75840 [Longispora fulva]|nr:hypothetical protein Lfu02_75840 [Longispora fulva]